MPNSVFLFPSGASFNGPGLFPDGSASAPGIAFVNEPSLGIFRGGTNDMRFGIGGATPVIWTGGGVNFSSAYTLSWAADTFLARSAAGKLTLTGTTPMLQLGGTTSSFPAIKQSGAGIDVRLADDSGYATFAANNVTFFGNIKTSANGVLAIGSAAPTISSGFGTSPTIPSANGTVGFLVNVGTGGTATSGVIGLPAATTGWILHCIDITAAAAHTGLRTVQTASTTTTATIESQNSAGAATAWAASSIVRIIAMAY